MKLFEFHEIPRLLCCLLFLLTLFNLQSGLRTKYWSGVVRYVGLAEVLVTQEAQADLKCCCCDGRSCWLLTKSSCHFLLSVGLAGMNRRGWQAGCLSFANQVLLKYSYTYLSLVSVIACKLQRQS